MTKKIIISIALAFALVCVLAFSAFAADPVNVYVKNGATGNGLSADTPIGNIVTAGMLSGSAPCVINVIGEYPISSLTTLTDVNGNVTVKGLNGGKLVLSSNLAISINKNENTFTIDLPVTVSGSSTVMIFGGFNNVVFTKNFTVSAPDGGKLRYYGGLDASDNLYVSPEIPYSITVNNGTFAVFSGGNVRSSASATIGSIIAPVTITINGGTFGTAGTYSTASNNKNYDTFSVSGMSFLADDATLNINGGTFNAPIYVQGRMGEIYGSTSYKSSITASDKKYYALDGDISVNITGGTFNGGAVGAYYTQAGYTTLMRGNYTVNVTGGTFAKDTLFDATQVKAYAGSDEKAVINYTVSNVKVQRFDVVNGKEVTYTEPLRVVFIGDSITEGAADAGAKVNRLLESYPANFLKLCEEAGKEVIVGNFGVGGAGFLPKNYNSRYYEFMLAYPLVTEETDPDIVFFAMGTNDSRGIGGTSGAIDEFEKQYIEIIDKMASFDTVDNIYITSAIFRLTSKPVEDLRMVSVLHPVQERIAENYAKHDSRVKFVDLYGLTLDMAITDDLFRANNGTIYERLHPTHNGLAFMGKCCYDAAFNGVYAPAKNYQRTEIYISDSGNKYGAGTADDPISFLPYACGLAAKNKEVTFYVKGTVTFSENIFFPMDAKKINIVGVGSDAKFSFGSSSFKFRTDMKFDNITLEATGSSAYMFACFNDVEITSSVKMTGNWNFYLGHNAFADTSVQDVFAANEYDTVSSVSSDNDCTVIINGGTFYAFALGNTRSKDTAPMGVYSGDITFVVGEGAQIGKGTLVGLVGQNYHTGTINANIAKWLKTNVSEYVSPGVFTHPISFDPAKNTGKVNVTLGSSTNKIDVMGDFDGNGVLGLGDVLLALSYVLDGFDNTKTGEYYGYKLETLGEVLSFVKRIG